jgi:hypothetical protein
MFQNFILKFYDFLTVEIVRNVGQLEMKVIISFLIENLSWKGVNKKTFYMFFIPHPVFLIERYSNSF